jgi:hypothetical protein
MWNEDVWRSKDKAPLILKLSAGLSTVMTFTPRSVYSRALTHWTGGRVGPVPVWSLWQREEESLIRLPSPSPVTVLTELPQSELLLVVGVLSPYGLLTELIYKAVIL